MNIRRIVLFGVIPLLPVLAAEIISYQWMNPTIKKAYTYPTLNEPFADPTFKSTPEKFDEIKGMLSCSQGWMGNAGSEKSANTQLVWIEWNHTSTGSIFQTLAHKPEECMSLKGFKLECIYPQRVFGSGDEQLVFDSTLFRPLRGGQAIHVFKAIWISGVVGASYRKNLFDGTRNDNLSAGDDLRTRRLATAKNRFKPEHARVLMAGVTGLPSEELAWKSFSREILPQIQWTTVHPPDAH